LIGQSAYQFFHPEDLEQIRQSHAGIIERPDTFTVSYRIQHKHSHYIWFETTSRTVRDAESGEICEIISASRDITERKEFEAQQRRLQEEIIEAQASTVRELSTPLIPITDQVMVMPLIGAVDTQRAQQVMETILEGIQQHRARIAILDITGVTVVDTQVANALIQTAQAVQLLGAQIVLTGIRPDVAHTMVMLGVDLKGIVTRATLQAGIAYATGGKL
jgi:rsbT co-antagonist protein RsbR